MPDCYGIMCFHIDSFVAILTRRQTIDKVGQLFGRGLVSEDNRRMKSLNHDTGIEL